MDAALEYGINCFNVESEEELEALTQVAQSRGCVAPVAFRMNPNISARTHSKITTGTAASKFGIPFERMVPLYKRAQSLSSIDPIGVDMHLGSQMTDLTPLNEALERLASLVGILRGEGIALRHVDVGGGLGIPYHHHDVVPTLSDYAAVVRRHIAPLELTLVVEPGRFLVGDTGILVTRVLYRKTTQEKIFLIVDGGMNDLIRPTLYDMPHMILPVIRPERETQYETVDVVGPVCESGDYLGRECRLPTGCKAGDLLAVMTAGAYGAVLSGTYNSRRLLPEVMVRQTEYDIVRHRSSYEDLIAKDSLPYWLTKKEVK
jgi:diaminopimelate decarboxylase